MVLGVEFDTEMFNVFMAAIRGADNDGVGPLLASRGNTHYRPKSGAWADLGRQLRAEAAARLLEKM